MISWIETHAHLEDEAFAADRPAMLERARSAGVAALVNPGSTPAANAALLDLCGRETDVYAGIGLHPHEFPRCGAAELAVLPDQLSRDRVVAAGEIGLDYHLFPGHPAPDRAAQQQALAAQLRLARLFELPLILHIREAYADAWQALEAVGPFPAGGVLHCYSGGPEELERALGQGWHVGIGGPVTYPKAEPLRQAVAQAGLDRLLLETDAPYLPPQSQRGRRNEPAFLPEVGAAVAGLRGLSVEALAQATSENARRLFRLYPGDPGRLVYELGPNLYVNLTNRCTADCRFCPRRHSRMVQGLDLTLAREPRADEVIRALGDVRRFDQVVFCGFGEPLLRLPALLAAADEIKRQGRRVRVNTNGQADLIFGRDILPECRGRVDEWSISVNSTRADQYAHWVRPSVGGETAHAAVIDFARRAAASGFAVVLTAVELPEIDRKALQELAARIGARYRGRPPERLGEPENRRRPEHDTQDR